MLTSHICCLVVGLGLRLGVRLVLASGCLVVMYTFLCYVPLSFYPVPCGNGYNCQSAHIGICTLITISDIRITDILNLNPIRPPRKKKPRNAA